MKLSVVNGLKQKASLFIAAMLVATVCMSAAPAFVKAAVVAGVTSPAPAAKISFTFDDGMTSAVTKAAPILKQYGLAGTEYVPTGCVGMTTVNNTCHANTSVTYLTWTQIKNLQTTYGWEIASHTVTHPYLATSDATDGQPNVLTPAQVKAELVNSRNAFTAQGITATDFASPYGDYNNAVLAQIAKVYASHRGFADHNDNVWPYNDYLINDFPVQEGVTVAQVEAKIDAAIANKQWLVLTMHNIKTTPSPNPDNYEYSTAELTQIAAYVKAKVTSGLIQSVNMNQGLVNSTSNLLPNGSFNNGIADGWTTDNASAVTKDIGNNGSYPDATNSIKVVANSASARLYSPKVAVNSSTTYVLKNFLNVQKLTSGGVEFYIDEYDASGNWISGQYKRAETSSYVENFNFGYTPSSPAVATADLQITTSANSGITAYLDNAQWFAVSTAATAPTNLLTNGTFDNGLSGWSSDDAANITADATGNGSPANATNSVKLLATTKETHLFSAPIVVDATRAYTLTNYLNIQSLTSGVVGFYIDEYDVSGNWISGQYKTDTHTLGAQTVGFAYKPSSLNVKKASLQVILVANSGVTAYFDDANWYLNN